MANRPLTLFILVIIFAINFADRQILAILVEPIKRDFNLSDADVGLLYGLAFAVLYTTAGIPIARFADRANRARIIVCSLALFSMMTAFCGLAANYWQLLLARIGVAIGEGGTNPPSHSIISEIYPIERRSTAMGLFSVGPNLGILLGFLIGGGVGQIWGWRAAFVVAGLGALPFAAFSFAFLEEPKRGRADVVSVCETPPLLAVLRLLVGRASIRHLFAGGVIFSMAANAVIAWLPSFLIRTHALSTGTAGAVLAILLGVIGGVGTVLGGMLGGVNK